MVDALLSHGLALKSPLWPLPLGSATTPMASTDSMYGVRPAKGKSSTCLVVIACATEPLAVSTVGAAAVTVTVWEVSPTSSRMSTTGWAAVSNKRLSRTNLLKPGASAAIR